MQDDMEKLQGKWRQVHYERDGIIEPTDEEEGWQPVTEIVGDRFSVTIADGSVVLEGRFEVGAERTPKEIDWLDESGSYASEHPILAVYQVTETTLTFCAAYEGGARPTALKSGWQGPHHAVNTLITTTCP